jgi:Amt family ammonium transporter
MCVDRVNLYGLTAFMLIWHLVVYAPIAHIVWQYNGVLFDNDIQDFSGGMVVHMTAGMTALVAHLFLNWVDAPFPEDTRPIHKEETLLSGVFCYWLANFGLQAGKAYNAGFLASQTIVNVIAATMTSILLNYFLDQVFSVPNSTTSLTNAVLIGIVSSSAAGGFVSVGGVMCISVLCMLVVRLVGKVAFDEGLNNRPYTVLSIHGLGGTIAFLFTPFFSHQFLSSRAYKGLIDNSPTAIRYQTAAVVTFWAAGSLAAFVALLFSNLIVPLSKARQSGKGDFAPTPIGPFTGDAKDKQHAGQYKPNASFNIGKSNHSLLRYNYSHSLCQCACK